jgi:tetratricopeptide (TPR) repeat protein
MERAVRLSGGNAELLVRLGDMYLARGNLQRAANQAESAIQANRQLASAWALRGDVLGQSGHHDESLASYHRALSHQEHYPRVQLAIAQTYGLQGRHARALATLRSLADGYPVDEVPPDVLFLQGIALKELGRYEAAVEALSNATKQGEPSPDLLFQLAECQMLAGDPINAKVTTESALAKAPEHGPSLALDQHLRSIQRRFARPDVEIRQR